MAGVYDKFISGHLAKVYSKFISRGQMQLRLEIWQGFMTSLLVGIWQRFIPSLLVGDRCSRGLRLGRGLLEVYQGWTDAASAGDQEEVY